MKSHYQHCVKKIRSLPTPLAGLALGIGGLGMCIDAAFNLQGQFETLTMSVVALILLVLALRFALHFDSLVADLQHPVLGSVVPTFAMALMVLSHGVGLYLPQLATLLWLAGITLHVVFLSQFIRYRWRQFSLHHMVPSWFVPPVGIAVAAVTWSGLANDWTHHLAWLCMAFALLSYALMMPAMFYRLMFCEPIAHHAQPTIAILAAPASLTLAGYLKVSLAPNPLLVMVMLGLALMMTLIVYGAFLRLLRLPFSPGFASFTFPLAIGATALYKVEAAFTEWQMPAPILSQIDVLAYAELSIAALVIAYVIVRYMMFGFSHWVAKA